MQSLWGCQEQGQLGAACTATTASPVAATPASEFQSIFDEWRGALPTKDDPAMPPSPQTTKDSRLGAAAASAVTAAQAPASPVYVRRKTNSCCSPTSKASPKTPKASCKGSAKDVPEPDPCGPTLDSFAGRFGFTVTTSMYCTSYSNLNISGSQEIVLENRSSAPKAEEAVATKNAASPAADEPSKCPAAIKTEVAASMQPAVPVPSTAADINLMLPPMPRLPATALLSQASFQQQPITPAADAAAQRPAAASPHGSPGFFRTVSTGMPGLLHSNSSAHESQALAAAAAAASAGDDCHQANHPHMNQLQQLSSYLKSMPDLTGDPQQQHSCMKQHAAATASVDPTGLQAQAAAVFGAVGALRTFNPSVAVKEEGATPADAVMMPSDWSPMQSFNLSDQFEATQQYLATHSLQQQLLQQQQRQPRISSWRPDSTSLKPSSPIKSKNGGSPSKSRNPASPSRQTSSGGNRQQYVISTAYKAILCRSLRRPKLRGPRYNPSSKTGASLLGKHRLSSCSSVEDTGPEGMPHEWVGNTSMSLNELESWGDEMGASLGSDGFEGFVFPVDSAFADEDGMQLQPPLYACMSPAAAAAAAASGIGLGARRASSVSSDWYKEMGVQDLAGSRRCSLFNDSISVKAPVAVGGDGIDYYRCSDADVESEVQRGLAFRPVWGVQACVGRVGLQCLLEGDVTPDKFYDGLLQDS